jgi:hypothetical protein
MAIPRVQLTGIEVILILAVKDAPVEEITELPSGLPRKPQQATQKYTTGQPSSETAKALTTEDTKVHEGKLPTESLLELCVLRGLKIFNPAQKMGAPGLAPFETWVSYPAVAVHEPVSPFVHPPAVAV